MSSKNNLKGVLVLEDGSIFEGRGFGSPGEAFGEVVFNTSMTGYQEALTDPSYHGQILMMTYPLQGNYGVSPSYTESERVWARAFVVTHVERQLSEYLKERGIPGVEINQTRELTLKIRERGTMMGAVITYPPQRFFHLNVEDVLRELERTPTTSEVNLVRETSVNREMVISSREERRIVLWDFGAKRSILRLLHPHGTVIRVPWNTTLERIKEIDPHLIVLSNGPGDPQHSSLLPVRRAVRELAEVGYPIFGICLGAQIIALSFGGMTYKLKFGHRGANHPVEDLRSGIVHITTQNHGFAVDEERLPEDLEVSHRNLNDFTVEGILHRELKVFGLQYHPEGGPGPHDEWGVFERVVRWAGGGGE